MLSLSPAAVVLLLGVALAAASGDQHYSLRHGAAREEAGAQDTVIRLALPEVRHFKVRKHLARGKTWPWSTKAVGVWPWAPQQPASSAKQAKVVAAARSPEAGGKLLLSPSVLGATRLHNVQADEVAAAEQPTTTVAATAATTVAGVAATTVAGAVATTTAAAAATTVAAAPTPFPLPPTEIRPSIGGQPDVVKFALLTKDWFGVDFKAGTFTADLVMTLKWHDARTTALVPPGKQELTMSQEEAAAKMWMPDVAITNRERGGVEVISTAIRATTSGDVTKVQRVLATVKNSYDIRAFPFDSQQMKVRIASTVLMADELTLSPMVGEEATGVTDGIFDGKEFSFTGTESHSFVQEDGILKKSRGELVIEVSRRTAAYFRSLILPEMVLCLICYSTFHFPVMKEFIMPRVATTMISFLSLMTLALRTGSMLPVRGSLSWIDVFEEACQMCMFCMLCLNIFVEVVAFELEQKPNADRFQFELKVGCPILMAVAILVCFMRTDGEWLTGLAYFTRTVIFVTVFLYVGYCAKRVHDYKKAAAEAGDRKG